MASFRHGWRLRQYWEPRLVHHGKRAQIAVFDMRCGRCRTGEAERGMARDHRGDRRTRAVEGDMHEVKPEREAKCFAKQMTGLAGTRRSVAVFAGIGFDECD